MTNEEYMRQACSTRSNLKNFTEIENITHMVIGSSTEANEALDVVKKYLYYGEPLDVVNLKEEVGDQLWYIANLLDTIGSSFEEVMTMNIAKLKARYPEQFTREKAVNRDLEKERRILEK